jgi:branched-chain amino acid transport system substrate-binding protein
MIAGGIDGRPVEVIYEDSKCSGSDAASAAQKLVSIDGVKFIVGGVCSSEVYGYTPITNAAEVLTITPGGSAPGISELGDYVLETLRMMLVRE